MKKKAKAVAWNLFKLGISLALDAVDFFLSAFEPLGTIFDIFVLFMSIWLWGEAGLTATLEIFVPFVDSFIPIATISGLLSLIGANRLLKKIPPFSIVTAIKKLVKRKRRK